MVRYTLAYPNLAVSPLSSQIWLQLDCQYDILLDNFQSVLQTVRAQQFGVGIYRDLITSLFILKLPRNSE